MSIGNYHYLIIGILYLVGLGAFSSSYRAAMRYTRASCGLAICGYTLERSTRSSGNPRQSLGPQHAEQQERSAMELTSMSGDPGPARQVRRRRRIPRSGERSQPHVAIARPQQTPQEQQTLCLCADIGHHKSVARTVRLCKNDGDTFRSLRKAFYSCGRSWWRWKYITGIRFYRVRPRLFPSSQCFVIPACTDNYIVQRLSTQRQGGSPLHRRSQRPGTLSG
jgi:hypothetical protein